MEKDQLHKSEVTVQVSSVLSSPVISSSDAQTARTDNTNEAGMEIDTTNQDSEKAGKDPLQSEELQDTRCLTTETESNVKSATEARIQSERKEGNPNKELTSGMKKFYVIVLAYFNILSRS